MQLPLNRRFFTCFIQVDEGYRRRKKDVITRGDFFTVDFNQVFHRGGALSGFRYRESEYFTQADRMTELNCVQCDRDKAIARVLYTGRNIGELIDPFEQVAAKQRALIIHVFRLYQFPMVHNLFRRNRAPV